MTARSYTDDQLPKATDDNGMVNRLIATIEAKDLRIKELEGAIKEAYKEGWMAHNHINVIDGKKQFCKQHNIKE